MEELTMADVDKYVVLKATDTTPFKANTIAYIVGNFQYYSPQKHRIYTKHPDGSFTEKPHRDKYYDDLWKKYIDAMDPVVRTTLFMFVNIVARETNGYVK